MAREILALDDDAATAALGQKLAARLHAGDVVLLAGGLGAGKTALARAIIRTLCEDPGLEVPSPSFALVQPYAFAGGRVLHADFYRLGSAAEVEELGVFDDRDAIAIVEWPERAEAILPRKALRIKLSIPPDGRGRIAEIDA